MARLASCAIVLCVFFVSPARAQDASADERKEAATHFQKGLELYQEAALDAALVEFERAYELVPHYRVLFNLARVQTERHEYVEAIALYERYLEEGESELDEERRKEVLAELDTLKGRVARLDIKSDVEGVTVFIEGKVVGETPLSSPVYVNGGLVHLKAEKPGYVPFEKEFKVVGGEEAHVLIPLVPESEAASSPVVTAPDSNVERSSRISRAPLWVSLSSTVALGAAAGVFGGLALSKSQQIKKEQESYVANPERIEDLRSSGKNFALVADVLTGAAVVAGGLTIYFAVRSSQAKESTQSAKLHELRLVPTWGGASLRGSF